MSCQQSAVVTAQDSTKHRTSSPSLTVLWCEVKYSWETIELVKDPVNGFTQHYVNASSVTSGVGAVLRRIRNGTKLGVKPAMSALKCHRRVFKHLHILVVWQFRGRKSRPRKTFVNNHKNIFVELIRNSWKSTALPNKTIIIHIIKYTDLII